MSAFHFINKHGRVCFCIFDIPSSSGSFARILPTFCRQTVQPQTTKGDTIRCETYPGIKLRNTKCYLEGLGGTSYFLLLIRVSQVRDLYGLPVHFSETHCPIFLNPISILFKPLSPPLAQRLLNLLLYRFLYLFPNHLF